MQGVFFCPSFAEDFSQFEGSATGCKGQKQVITAHRIEVFVLKDYLPQKLKVQFVL